MTDAREMLPEIEWEEGYPTEASIDALSKVGINAAVWLTGSTAAYLRTELAKCADNCCASYAEEPAMDIMGKPCLHLHFSTGGWSGAEELIETLLKHFWIRNHHVQWNRGGHYVFEVPA